MRILSFEIVGLFGREGTISANLHEDLNILTGRNGSGKTSILKLLWYVVSGNILIALREIPFSKITLVTTEYECTVYSLSRSTCKIDFATKDGAKSSYEDTQDEDGDILINAEDEPNRILRGCGDSVFLPTFRRIEGGFTIGPVNSAFRRVSQAKSDVEESLLALSKKLSQNAHTFVSSISTSDVASLLLRKYSELSDTYTDIQQTTSQEIITTIKEFKSDMQDVRQIDAANKIIDQIRAKVESMEARREEIMTPIEGVRKMVALLFQHSGIKIGNRLNFGDAANAVNSDTLSAGEKQMLSFICYNAFNKNSIIFIDEPELSLHVDWQRQLFSILGQQGSSNQFIIATHSPFIYSKYPEKEIAIGIDKGDSGKI